MIKQLVFIAVS